MEVERGRHDAHGGRDERAGQRGSPLGGRLKGPHDQPSDRCSCRVHLRPQDEGHAVDKQVADDAAAGSRYDGEHEHGGQRELRLERGDTAGGGERAQPRGGGELEERCR